MKITINGNSKELSEPIALDQLVSQFCKNSKHVIAEVNGEILRAPQWSQKTVADGDVIELVSFVGGG
jgi:sulfur carrier protein